MGRNDELPLPELLDRVLDEIRLDSPDTSYTFENIKEIIWDLSGSDYQAQQAIRILLISSARSHSNHADVWLQTSQLSHHDVLDLLVGAMDAAHQPPS
jgi:hypothetical protein